MIFGLSDRAAARFGHERRMTFASRMLRTQFYLRRLGPRQTHSPSGEHPVASQRASGCCGLPVLRSRGLVTSFASSPRKKSPRSLSRRCNSGLYRAEPVTRHSFTPRPIKATITRCRRSRISRKVFANLAACRRGLLTLSRKEHTPHGLHIRVERASNSVLDLTARSSTSSRTPC